ncbi:TPA: primase C-terminal domain-containing protein, partial [Klebsiella pneumoniae]
DNGYVGLIAKNPLHEKWDNHILSSELYDLNYLADFVNLEQLPRNQHVSGLGRNCTLFDIVRIWAYKAIREHSDSYYAEWEAEVLTRALHANTAFSSPLEYQEVKQTARSIAKWVWRNHGSAEFQANFSAKQAKKGRKGGLKSDSSQGGKARSQQYSDMRHEALKLHLQGMKQIDIAKQLNVSDRTIRTWIKNRKVQA